MGGDSVELNLIKRADLAKAFGVNKRTVMLWEQAGRITPIKISHHVYYRTEAVEELIKEAEMEALANQSEKKERA